MGLWAVARGPPSEGTEGKMPGKGHDHYIQIGREAVWGTDVAATRRLNVVSTDMGPVFGKVRSDTITAARNRAQILLGPGFGRASIEVDALFTSQLHLWDAAFGTATYAADGGTMAGVGPYVWTFKQRALFNSYTIEGVTNIPAGKADQLVGAKLNRFRFSGSTGLDAKPCRLATEWIGKTWSDNVTPTGALTATTPISVMPGHIDTAALDVGTADAAGLGRLKSFEFAIDNKLTDDRYYGAATMDEPLTDDYAETTCKWAMEFTSNAALDEYIANTAGNPTIKFAQSANVYIQFAMGAGYIVTPVNRPINRWGILTQEFGYEAVDDGGSPSTGLTVTISTTEATIS